MRLSLLLLAASCFSGAAAWSIPPPLAPGLASAVSPSAGLRSSVPAFGLPLKTQQGLSVGSSRRQTRNSALSFSAKLQTGIVGLPNVGKSTLFNALLQKVSAEAANFPFCTIEPNVGLVPVPDPRVDKLAEISSSAKIIPTSMEFVDIAGIVKGASEGQGLGNKFLANIRECDAIVHVVRCFEDDDVIHVDGSVDPARDMEVIDLELLFADLAQVEKRLDKVIKETKGGKKPEALVEKGALERIKAALDDGKAARTVELDADEEKQVKNLGLLTRKPVIYATNVADSDLATGNEMVETVRKLAEAEGAKVVVVSAQVEAEMAEFDKDEKAEFLGELGIDDPNSTGLNALVTAAYELLGLRTYFTTGPTETRAWTINAGWKAPQAAGVIHQDFERGFIRAETISYEDLVKLGSEKAAKEAGVARSEGKDYEVQDGDCILFRFNV